MDVCDMFKVCFICRTDGKMERFIPQKVCHRFALVQGREHRKSLPGLHYSREEWTDMEHEKSALKQRDLMDIQST
jgi:hypothetical protein